MKKTKELQPEIFELGEQYAPIFKKAIENTEKRTYVKNNSIFVNDNGKVTVNDTIATFLINVGMEYQKLLMEEK